MEVAAITAESIVRRDRDVPFSELDDERIAIDARTGFCYSLNESAGKVWDLMSAPIEVVEICARLQREYAIDDATCRTEVIRLVQGLHDAGLVQVGQASPG